MIDGQVAVAERSSGWATILIVDDTPANLGVVVDSLQDERFEVMIARDGPEGLRRAAFVKPDIILLDVMMPGMDGFEVCRRLKAQESTRDIPVLFMTALMEVRDKLAGFEAGGVDYVTKPVQIDEVVARVNAHLNLRNMQKRVASQNARLQDDREKLELLVAERTQQLRTIFDTIPELMWVTDTRGGYRDCNPAFEKYFGVAGEKLAEQTDDGLVDAGLAVFLHEKDREAMVARETIMFEVWLNIAGSGQQVLLKVSKTPMFDKRGEVESVLSIAHDITPLRQAEQRLSHMARYDELTGLPNRALFRERLSLAMAHADRYGLSVGLLLIDLDNFKEINDTLRHTVGDELLKWVGGKIRALLHDEDMVARLGGDEFAIVMPNVSRGLDLDAAVAKILCAISAPVLIEGHQLLINASMGVAVYPDDGTDCGVMLRNADTAMCCAKAQGRGGYRYFDEDMNRDRQERRSLVAGIRQALDNGEFELHFQPKVMLDTGNVGGMEALIRWRHPQQGMIPPARFIPVAEDCGLIADVGAWVITAAVRQLATWRDMGLTPVKVAVNLSAGQCQSEETLLLVDQLLEAHGISGEYLEMEITESMVMHDTRKAIDIFGKLKERGVSVAIDDFGTGHSSLSYLKHFPIDSLKIDKSFVDDIGTGKNVAEIVCAIIALAHSLGMRVVAEGVETKTQLDFLRNNGCDEVQGYYYSKPLPAPEMAEFLRQERRPLLE